MSEHFYYFMYIYWKNFYASARNLSVVRSSFPYSPLEECVHVLTRLRAATNKLT